MRRFFLAAVLGIAFLFGASVFLIDSWTSAPPSVSGGTVPAPPAPAVSAPVAVPPPAATVPDAVPPPAASVHVVPPSIPGPKALPPPKPQRPQVRVLGTDVDRLKVSFKLDPRLTQGLHMGERWVSPPTYVSKGKGSLLTIAARASGVDAEGRPFKNPTWSPAQRDLVAVEPEQGAQVEITVLQPGESSLIVHDRGATRTLKVKAVEQGGIWQVNITQ